MKFLIYNRGIKRNGQVEYEEFYLNADLIKSFHISTDGKYLSIRLIDGEEMIFRLGGSCPYADGSARDLAEFLTSEDSRFMAIGNLTMSFG